jgi:Transposase DDE domain
MDASVSSDGLFCQLVQLAGRICRRAEVKCPRRGPGRRPEIPDWVLATLIVVSVIAQKRSKSAQFRFIHGRAAAFEAAGITRLPSRSVYFDRYRRAWRLLQTAIAIEGRLALARSWAHAQIVAVDKSIIAAQGRRGHIRQGRPCRVRDVDRDAGWGRNEHDGWVWGYSYEVVVSAQKTGSIWPLLASADPANRHEIKTFRDKLKRLPRSTRAILADRAYDADDFGEAVEWTAFGRRTQRRWVCPQIKRAQARRPRRQNWKRSGQRQLRQQHRRQRDRFFHSPRGQRLYARRFTSVEPFNAWFKDRFELHSRVWHRGIDNNRTQILASILSYQLLLHLNRLYRRPNGCIKWIIDLM